MRYSGWGFLVLIATLAGGLAMAEDRSRDEAAVRALDDQERIAALERDVKALERLWSEQFTVNAPNNRVVAGRKNVLDTFVHAGVINFSSFERDVELVKADGPFVIIMGLERLVPMSDAPEAGLITGQEVKRRFTNIWKYEDGTWRLFVRHANVVPAR